mgnify:CR=1 FL=1
MTTSRLGFESNTMEVNTMKVGIIGAGTMGSGIAQAFAQTEGYEVYLCDINEEFAANGKNKIAKGDRRWTTQNISEKETKKITLGNKVRWIFVICIAV